ncbi:MAG: 50S ribosomal protein L23 [Firmicutes bacterium ADurb.Bin356]|nr:MAG: 50S ribosomal protein L23 [Firmicutes bacterium ADurb.Bin356]
MKNPHDIIRRPVLSERTYGLLADKVYTFEVDVKANKVEIKKAVEEIFDVKVDKVNTLRTTGKLRRQGAHAGRTPEVKKAFEVF